MNRDNLISIVRNLLNYPNEKQFLEICRTTPLADLADIIKEEHPSDITALLLLLPSNTRASLFTYLPSNYQDKLLKTLPKDSITDLFAHLPSDDRADLYNRLSHLEKKQLLPALAKTKQEDILKMSSYSEGTVGSVITSDYATIDANITITEALEHLRLTAPNKETIYVVYVLDAERKLLGNVLLHDLILAKPTDLISSLVQQEPIYARPEWPRNQAAELIRRYDLLALPVVDNDNQMIGILTVDDAMDIEKEDDAAKLARFGGTASLGGPDLALRSSSFYQMFSMRFIWLAVLTFFGIVTSTFVAGQTDLIEKVIILAAFMAPIVDMGGNSGSQAAALVIRAMALGEVKLSWKDVWFVLKKEMPVAMVLGICIAILEVVLAYFAKGVGIDVLIVVGLSMFTITAIGGITGAMLPFLARRIGTDPATLSAPLITSIMDLLGAFIFFGIAYLMFADLLVA